MLPDCQVKSRSYSTLLFSTVQPTFTASIAAALYIRKFLQSLHTRTPPGLFSTLSLYAQTPSRGCMLPTMNPSTVLTVIRAIPHGRLFSVNLPYPESTKACPVVENLKSRLNARDGGWRYAHGSCYISSQRGTTMKDGPYC